MNSSELELNKSMGESSNCFKSSICRKRKHSETVSEQQAEEDVAIVKKSKPSFFESFRNRFSSKKYEPETTQTRSILSFKSENRLQGETQLNPFSPNQSFISSTNTPTRKRVKFDEENLIKSSITYQRQLDNSYLYTGIIPAKKSEKRTILGKIFNLFD